MMDAAGKRTDPLAQVADGEPIDWSTVRLAGAEEADPSLIEALRLLEEVANVHRALPDDGDVAGQRPGPGRWGKYVLTERLGAGSFGEVYRGWDPALRRHAAIKLLHPGLPGGENVSGRLIEEGQRLASVRHENIVSVFEVEQHGGRPALCMDFVRGRTLDEVVRLEGTLSALEAARVGMAVAGALGAVHAVGLLHRDVKANNVMREVSGRIVLMDFGSGVRFLPGAAPSRAIVGTPLYMAPELFGGVAATPESDIYSVGVLLYFLVSGRYPIEGATLDAVVEAHRRGRARPLAEAREGLPAGFVEIVNRALSPEPGVRHDSAADLQAELAALVRALERRDSLLRLAGRSCGMAAAVVILIGLLGFVTTATYWFLLGISGPFVAEGPRELLTWGLRSLVAPAAMAAFVTGLLYLALECLALGQKMWPPLRRAVAAARTRVRRAVFAHQIELRDRARLAVIASVAFLVWVPTMGFPELVAALLGEPLSTAADETMQLFGPGSMTLHDRYRQTLAVGFTAMCAGWMTLWRSARRRGTPLGSAGWLGFGCVLATLVLMELPYRIRYHNQAERARYDSADCYVSAESSESVLLFCPQTRPRVFSVDRSDMKLIRLKTFGSLFETIK